MTIVTSLFVPSHVKNWLSFDTFKYPHHMKLLVYLCLKRQSFKDRHIYLYHMIDNTSRNKYMGTQASLYKEINWVAVSQDNAVWLRVTYIVSLWLLYLSFTCIVHLAWSVRFNLETRSQCANNSVPWSVYVI